MRLAVPPLLLVLMSCASGQREKPPAASPTVHDMAAREGPLVIAHRGASAYAPEHTFAAWDLAVAMGADYLEQDLQLTRDGHLVVLHDETLDRTARGPSEYCTGPVSERTLEELRTCEVGSWFNEANPSLARPEYRDLRIPTLDEVLARYGPGQRYYIETKKPEAAARMERKLVELLTDHGLLEPAQRDRRVLVQSFSASSLRRLAELAPKLPLIRLFDDGWTSDRIRSLLPRIAGNLVGIGPHREAVDRELIDAAEHLGLEVHPYTVDDDAEMERLVDLGVHGLFTNRPDRLVALREGHR